MNSMKKSAFISRLAAESGLTKAVANKVYKSFLNIIVSELMNGGSVSLTGFGVFTLAKHKGHEVSMNFEIASTEKKVIDDYYILKFRASDTLKRKLRTHAAPVGEIEIRTEDDG